MPNIKSSKKDVLSSKIAYEKNKADKSELKKKTTSISTPRSSLITTSR